MKAEFNSQKIESSLNASARVPPARPNESDLPEWTWFIANAPGPEPSHKEVVAGMVAGLEPLDE